MIRPKFNLGRKLAFQQLENRALMTGNVSVAVQNHSLVVTGDNKDNAIEIYQVASGQYAIRNQDGTTTINHQSTPQTFSGVTGDFKIDLKGGNDVLNIDTASGGLANITIPGNLNINLNNGNDVTYVSKAIVGGSLSETGGNGNHVLYVFDSKIGNAAVNGGQNDLKFNLGSGNVILDVFNTTVERDANVKLSGNVITDFQNTTVGRDLNETLNSNHTKYNILEVFGGTVGRNATIQTGDSADSVSLNGPTVAQNLQIKTGNGDDRVVLGGFDTKFIGTSLPPVAVHADQVYVDLGKGNDTLGFGGNGHVYGGGLVANQATFLGGDGVDAVFNQSGSALFGSFTKFESMPPVIKPLDVVNLGGLLSKDV